jgi:hypothetical protein
MAIHPLFFMKIEENLWIFEKNPRDIENWESRACFVIGSWVSENGQEGFSMGWSEFLIVLVLLFALIAVLLFLQMRSFVYAAIFGFLFVVGVYAMMLGPVGEQIRKERQEDKAVASQMKRTG